MHLGRFGFKIARLRESKGTIAPLVKFEMNRISANASLETDGKITVHLGLYSIVLEDTRNYSPNIHRRLIAPTTKSDKENQLDLTYVIRPNGDMDIDVNMFSPRFVLLPDIYTELYTYCMELVSEIQNAFAEFSKKLEAHAVEQPKRITPTASQEIALIGLNFHLDVKIALRSPEIIVMEDPKKKGTFLHRILLKLIGTSSFILSLNEISVTVATNPETTYVQLNLKEFGMLRGELRGMTAENRGTLKRKIYLLNPFFVNLAIDQDKSHTKVTAKLGMMDAIISYRDVALVLAVVASFDPLINALTIPLGGNLTLLDTNKEVIEMRDDKGKCKEKDVDGLYAPLEEDRPKSIISSADERDARIEKQEIVIVMETFNINLLDDSRDSSFSTPLCKIILAEFLTTLRVFDTQDDASADYLDSKPHD